MTDNKKHLYKICPECDYYCNILEKNNYCPSCGTKLIEKCTGCNSGISYPFANYCGRCGKAYRTAKRDSSFKEL